MVQYTRSRSRQDLDTLYTVKYGTSTSKNLGGGTNIAITSIGNGTGQWKTNPSLLPLGCTIEGVTIPFAGVSVVSSSFSGTTYYRYDNTGLASRVNSYSLAICVASVARATSLHEAAFTLTLTGRSLSSSVNMSDVVTPKFQEISRNGGVVMSPLTSEKYAVNADKGETWTTPVTVSFTCTAFSATGTAPNSNLVYSISWTSAAATKYGFVLTDSILNSFKASQLSLSHVDGAPAINMAYSKMSQAELDLPLMLAEANKTISLLALTAMRLAKLVKGVKKQAAQLAAGKFPNVSWKDIPTSTKEFSSLWLEYRYGWRPLLMDLTKAVEYLKKSPALTPRRTFRGFNEDLSDTSIDWTTSEGGFSYRFVGSITTDRIARAGVLTEIDLGLETLRDLGGFNMAGTAWELIPYSFVVDWFIDVKGILASMNPNPAVKPLGSWCTYTSEKKFSGVVHVTHTASGQTKSLNYSAIVRKQLRDVGVVTNYINLDVNLDIYKLIDAAALLRMLRH